MKYQKKFLIVLSIFLLIFTCVSPAFALSACKEGKTNCTHPCGDYVDSNGNKICDRSETTTQQNSSWTLPLAIISSAGIVGIGALAFLGRQKK